MKAICIGHASYDITLPIESFPEENIKYRIENHVECGGGPASNAAYLLAKWGAPTSFVGAVGKDYYGDRIIEEFKQIGVDTTYLEQREDYRTSSSYIIANRSNGSRTIITSKDAKKVNLVQSEILLEGDVILVDGEEMDASIKVINEKKEALSILDAGTLKESTLLLGRMVRVLACSKDFAESFTKTKIDHYEIDFLATIHKELEEYFGNTVIITLESMGAFVKSDTYKIIPSIKVKAVDSTGAGDIFHGALAYFLGNHYQLEEAVRLANITGALSVLKVGGRYSIPTLEEVLEKSKERNEITTGNDEVI